MKQRVRVVGILREEGEVLLMKRRAGRSTEPVFWELPTGKIKFGEQPEEAMARTALEYLGVEVREVKLKDVVTFLAFEGSSQMANLYIVYELGMRSGTKIRPNERYSAFKFLKDDEFSKVRVDEATGAVLELENEKEFTGVPAGNYRETVNGATVYVDGSSRGNPGPSGVGYRIVGEDGREILRGGEFVGFATSRVAEYYALRAGVEKAIELGLKRVRFVGDNLMMMNQMNGIYKIKNKDLLSIYADIRKKVAELEAVSFVHVKRELNMEADREANLAIDRHFEMDVLK